jgi:hypothetical protein
MDGRLTRASRKLARARMLTVALLAACAETSGARSLDESGAYAGTDGAAATPDDSSTAGVPTCVQAEFPARALPLELAIVLDRSIVWTEAASKAALIEFADAADLSELSLSLQFIPHPTAVDQCDIQHYATPFVPMTPVPLVADELRAAFSATQYTWGQESPRSALAGTVQYLRERQQLTPLSQHAALMMMPGLASYCYSSVETVSTVAALALSESSIMTFVFGTREAYPAVLDPVARAGGTSAASYDDPDAGASWSGLVDSLRKVRLMATVCDMTLPVPEQGELDPARVRVLFHESEGAAVQSWPLFESIDGCSGGRDGFYYDNPGAPRVIRLCPASCAIARSAAGQAKLTVAADCVVLLE